MLTIQNDAFFENVFEYMTKSLDGSFAIEYQSEEMQKLISSNIEKNEDIKDLVKFRGEKAMAETNALFACGFKNAESNIEDLKNPYFEKYFTVLANSEE